MSFLKKNINACLLFSYMYPNYELKIENVYREKNMLGDFCSLIYILILIKYSYETFHNSNNIIYSYIYIWFGFGLWHLMPLSDIYIYIYDFIEN
jgi:hypothetical protein